MKFADLTEEMQALVRDWQSRSRSLIIGGPNCVCHSGMRHNKDRKRSTLIAEYEDRQRRNGVIVNQDIGDENNMNLYSLRRSNAPVDRLVTVFGREVVIDELAEMCYANMADWALESAIKISASVVAKTAATIILNSGSYSVASRESAKSYLSTKMDGAL